MTLSYTSLPFEINGDPQIYTPTMTILVASNALDTVLASNKAVHSVKMDNLEKTVEASEDWKREQHSGNCSADDATQTSEGDDLTGEGYSLDGSRANISGIALGSSVDSKLVSRPSFEIAAIKIPPHPTKTPLRVKVARKNAIDIGLKHASGDHPPSDLNTHHHGPDCASARAATPASADTSSDAEAISTIPPHNTTSQRYVLVAKCLTNSDANSGRIILPRVAVETNLSFVTSFRHYTLPVRCPLSGIKHNFVIKSWANGTEHRRVFVLEGAATYLRSIGAGVGDAIGICTDSLSGELVVEANTPEVRQATLSPKYGPSSSSLLSVPAAAGSHGGTVPLVLGSSARCVRSGHCTKPAGHPGFCSGPKASAASAAGGSGRSGSGSSNSRKWSKQQQRQQLHGSAFEGISNVDAGTTVTAGLDLQRASSSSFVYAVVAAAEAVNATTTTTLPLPSTHLSLPKGLYPTAYIPTGTLLLKPLTTYDLTSKRVVMPAPEIEESIHQATVTEKLTLAAVDESDRWQFPTLKAWTAVSGRRGYLLQDAEVFLSNRKAVQGDVLIVYRETDGCPPRIELRQGQPKNAGNGEEEEGDEYYDAEYLSSLALKSPSQPDSEITFASLPLLIHPEGHNNNKNVTCDNHQQHEQHVGIMSCKRTHRCTKHAGHQGFCSGHKGFKKRDMMGMGMGMGMMGPSSSSMMSEGMMFHGFGTGTDYHHHRNGGGGGRVSSKRHHRHKGMKGHGNDDGDWSDEDYTPTSKRPKKSGGATPRGGGGGTSVRGAGVFQNDALLSLLSLAAEADTS